MTSSSSLGPPGAPRSSLRELQSRYVDEERPLPAALEAELRSDPRPGAKALLAKVDRRRHARRAEGQRLRKMVRFETVLWGRGLTLVAGVDEAGMSPLAGPVVAGAVILPPGARLAEVDDSKKLDARTRSRLALTIRATCVAWGVGFALPEEIDRLNIYWAGLLAMRRAVEALGVVPEHLLIDARKLHDVPVPQERIVKGDEKSLSIAAASILAKTSRDAYMTELDLEHPVYGFARHKGYPVREHVEALFAHGACPHHRRSFDPVRRALGLPPLPPWPTASERATPTDPLPLAPPEDVSVEESEG